MKNGDVNIIYKNDNGAFLNNKEKQIISSKMIRLKKTPLLGKDFTFKIEDSIQNEKQIEIKKLNFEKISEKISKNSDTLSTSRISKFKNSHRNFNSFTVNRINRASDSCKNLMNTNKKINDNNVLKNNKRRNNSQNCESTIDVPRRKHKNLTNNLLFLNSKIWFSKKNKSKFENCKNSEYKNNKCTDNFIYKNTTKKNLKSNNYKNVNKKFCVSPHNSLYSLNNSKNKVNNFNNIKDYISFFIQEQKLCENKSCLNKGKKLNVGMIGQLIDGKIKKTFSRTLISDRVRSHYIQEKSKNQKK